MRAGDMTMAVPLAVLLLLLLQLHAASAQPNFQPWPDSAYWPDVSDPAISVVPQGADPNIYCSKRAVRYSFKATPTSQLVASTIKPPTDASGFCYDTADWLGVTIVAEFQTADYVPEDGIIGIWITGQDVLRGFFPEGKRSHQGRGEQRWTISKSITQFTSLFRGNKARQMKVVVSSRDDAVKPAIVNATIEVRIYPVVANGQEVPKYPEPVRPISRQPSGTVPWFLLGANQNSSVSLALPRNTISASIEVIATLTNSFIPSRSLINKEVRVSVDGTTAGFAYVNYVNTRPLREPLALSYSIDISPFVGTLVDGRQHTFTMTNPHSDVLAIDANLFVYRDSGTIQTSGQLREATSQPALAPAPEDWPLEECYQDCDYSTASTFVNTYGYVEGTNGVTFYNFTQQATYALYHTAETHYVYIEDSLQDLNVTQVSTTLPEIGDIKTANLDLQLRSYTSSSDGGLCSAAETLDVYYDSQLTQQGDLVTHLSHSSSDKGSGRGNDNYGNSCRDSLRKHAEERRYKNYASEPFGCFTHTIDSSIGSSRKHYEEETTTPAFC